MLKDQTYKFLASISLETYSSDGLDILRGLTSDDELFETDILTRVPGDHGDLSALMYRSLAASPKETQIVRQ